MVRVVMKVMRSVMIESKNDDDFCGGSSGSSDRAVDIHPYIPVLQNFNI